MILFALIAGITIIFLVCTVGSMIWINFLTNLYWDEDSKEEEIDENISNTGCTPNE